VDDLIDYNRRAWNHQSVKGNAWTLPVDREALTRAKQGDWSIVLTGHVPVPRAWFGELTGKRLLCLASGGGQQGPILAAAGARVTVFDLAEAQLETDRRTAESAGLEIRTIQGDMRDLSAFGDASFDIVVHPVSNCYVPDVRPLWREANRVLAPDGVLMAGFINAAHFIFDDTAANEGRLVVRHKIPFSELTDISETEVQRYREANEPLVFGHSLQDQIGGQLEAGFTITDFYEHGYEETPAIAAVLDTYMATRAVRRAGS